MFLLNACLFLILVLEASAQCTNGTLEYENECFGKSQANISVLINTVYKDFNSTDAIFTSSVIDSNSSLIIQYTPSLTYPNPYTLQISILPEQNFGNDSCSLQTTALFSCGGCDYYDLFSVYDVSTQLFNLTLQSEK
jgi:hypothetical protein